METYNDIPRHKIKATIYKYFHVFTDGRDEYIEVKDNYNEAKEEALKMAENWKAEGVERIRVYDVQEEEDFRTNEIHQDKEECIFSYGGFPY